MILVHLSNWPLFLVLYIFLSSMDFDIADSCTKCFLDFRRFLLRETFEENIFFPLPHLICQVIPWFPFSVNHATRGRKSKAGTGLGFLLLATWANISKSVKTVQSDIVHNSSPIFDWPNDPLLSSFWHEQLCYVCKL